METPDEQYDRLRIAKDFHFIFPAEIEQCILHPNFRHTTQTASWTQLTNLQHCLMHMQQSYLACARSYSSLSITNRYDLATGCVEGKVLCRAVFNDHGTAPAGLLAHRAAWLAEAHLASDMAQLLAKKLLFQRRPGGIGKSVDAQDAAEAQMKAEAASVMAILDDLEQTVLPAEKQQAHIRGVVNQLLKRERDACHAHECRERDRARIRDQWIRLQGFLDELGFEPAIAAFVQRTPRMECCQTTAYRNMLDGYGGSY